MLTLIKRPYRVWVNQPSSSQPLHHYHGLHGWCLEYNNGLCDFLFDKNEKTNVSSMNISKLFVSKE